MELQSYSRVVTFKVDPKLLELVDETAKELSISRSELIRAAIEEFLAKVGTFVNKSKNRNLEKADRSGNIDVEVVLL